MDAFCNRIAPTLACRAESRTEDPKFQAGNLVFWCVDKSRLIRAAKKMEDNIPVVVAEAIKEVKRVLTKRNKRNEKLTNIKQIVG